MDPTKLALRADLEWKLQVANKIIDADEICARYLVENRERILPRLMFKQQKYGGEIDEIVAQFIKGVHVRHLLVGNLE